MAKAQSSFLIHVYHLSKRNYLLLNLNTLGMLIDFVILFRRWYLCIIVGILPAGLIPKTTQNYKPLWVPNPKIPIDFRDKPNPTHTRGFFRVIPLGTQGYPP